MDRGRKAVGSPAHTESIRTVKRLRELIPKIGPARAAEQTGCSKAYATYVHQGKRGAGLEASTIDSLGLRRSSKFCRRCSKPAVIVTRSCLCIVCELLELAKQGLVSIEPEASV